MACGGWQNSYLMLLSQSTTEFPSKLQFLSEAMLGRSGLANNIRNVVLLDSNLEIANLVTRHN